jgi:hypothetical protein
MQKLVLIGALCAMALSACVSHNFREGERTNWRCDGGAEFNMRRVAGNVEVFAAGQTHTLSAADEDAYSNGDVTFTRDGGRATLSGVHGGPYENCRRTGVLPAVW